jgi:hypothetical protein
VNTGPTLVHISVLAFLTGCASGPGHVAGTPGARGPQTLTPESQYERLLTTPLAPTGLPDQAGPPALSRFVYADSGPTGLVGAVQAQLTPGTGTAHTLTFEVYATAAAARDRSFRGTPATVSPAGSTPLAVSQGTGWCEATTDAGTLTDEECTIIDGDLVIRAGATSTGTLSPGDQLGGYSPLDASSIAQVGLVHVRSTLPGCCEPGTSTI